MMCASCVDAIKRYFPDTPDAEYGTLLFNATPFPAGSAEDVRRCLRKARQARCKTWQEAIGWANTRVADTVDRLDRLEEAR